MTDTAVASGWRSPAGLGLLVGLGGLFIAGPVGGAVGIPAGVVAARRAQAVLIAAPLALAAAAVFTLVEQPLTTAEVVEFPGNQPLAELAAKVAAVLLLAGLAGIAAQRDWAPVPPAPGEELTPGAGGATAPGPFPTTVAAFVVVAALATLMLWGLGNLRWEAAALGTAISMVVLARAKRSVSLPRGLAVVPSPATVLSGLRSEHSHILGGSVWLLSGTLVLSLGSFALWILLAQRAPADAVGGGAALFSATLFVCYLTSLGLPIAVSRYASDRSQSSATMFAWSLVLTASSSLVGVAGFAAIAPESIRDGLAVWRPGFAWLAFFLLVVGQSISLLVDVRLMALRRWSLFFWRSVLIAVIRLPFVLWVPDTGAALYIYIVAAGAFALTGVAFLVPLAGQGWLRLRPLPAKARRAAQFAGVNYLGLLAVQAPFFVVPLVVLVQVDAVENARFYLSWAIMSVVYISIQMIGQALLVEGGRGGADHRRQAAVALGAGLAVAAFATVLSLGFGPLLSRLYGPAYAPVATLLPILVAGTIPFAVTMTLLTTARVREHSYSTIAIAAGFGVAVLVPTVLLTARHGALGAAWGWAIGNSIAAALALLASRLPTRRDREPLRTGAMARNLEPIPGRVSPRA